MKGKGHVPTEAEPGGLQLQAKDCPGPPAAPRSLQRRGACPRASEVSMTLPHLDFRLPAPRIGGNKFLLLKAPTFMDFVAAPPQHDAANNPLHGEALRLPPALQEPELRDLWRTAGPLCPQADVAPLGILRGDEGHSPSCGTPSSHSEWHCPQRKTHSPGSQSGSPCPQCR